MFNTLKYAKKLEEAGFTREQAEVSVKILIEIMEDRLATKEDIKDLKNEIAQSKSDLTIKMGAMIATAVLAVTAFVTFLVKLL